MTMKKQDRKEAYMKVIGLLVAGDNQGAFDAMVSLSASDSGIFIFNRYEDMRKAFEEKKEN